MTRPAKQPWCRIAFTAKEPYISPQSRGWIARKAKMNKDRLPYTELNAHVAALGGSRSEPTRYGFIWRDHTGKVMATVERACSSSVGDKRRWVALRIRTATEYIDIDIFPRKTHVRRELRPKESTR